jgi:electron transport complex protein RnfB
MSYTITDLCNGCGSCLRLCPAEAIEGEKKEKHRIEEALCIDCGVCGRICPEGAVVNSGGQACVMVKRSQWNKPRFDKKVCNSCNICIDACPVNCLGLSEAEGEKDPHGYPFLQDVKACIGCGFCRVECPVDAVVME